MATLATTPCDVKRCSADEVSSGPQPNASPAADQRLDGRKAAQFIREAQKNKNEIKKLENDRTLSLFFRKNGWTDVSKDLEKYKKVLEEEKEAEKMNLQKQLAKIHNDVRKFQRELSDVKPAPKLIERLTEIMSEVETSINTLKEKQRIRFEELLKEERTCRQEISAYEKKIDNWSLVVKSDTRQNQASTV